VFVPALFKLKQRF